MGYKKVSMPMKVKKIGKSWYIQIPIDVVRALGLRKNQMIWVSLEVNNLEE